MDEISRRSLVRAGAWSVPVVVAAVAAPAASASADTSSITVALDLRTGAYLRRMTVFAYLRDEDPSATPLTVEGQDAQTLTWRAIGFDPTPYLRRLTENAGDNEFGVYSDAAYYRAYRVYLVYKGAPLYSNVVLND